MFKNKFTQLEYGLCSYVALANLFNLEHIIEDGRSYIAENENKGVSYIQERKMVERYSNDEFTVQSLFFQEKPINQNVSSIFNIEPPEQFPTDQIYFNVFLAAIHLEKESNIAHAVLLIKKSSSNILHVLDPYSLISRSIAITRFFKAYNCSSVAIIADINTGGFIYFPKSRIDHLLLKD